MGKIAELNERLVRRTRWNGDCLEYDGARAGHMAYRRIRFQRQYWLVHRLVWTILRGPIPDGKIVMHTCDNPACCNPAHLWLGTIADNQHDMQTKGRDRPGRERRRATTLARPCSVCGGPRRLSGNRVRCPKGACRGGQ